MSKRPYEKKNQDYWNKISQPKSQSQEISIAATFEPQSFGDPYVTLDSETAFANTRENDSATSGRSRINNSAIVPKYDRFSQIRKLTLPFRYKGGCVDIRDAVDLCQRAYANVPAFRNAIDLMSEFANTDIYLEGGTKASRDFFFRWFKKINMTDLKDQVFREYYRSGNIFLYRVDGMFSVEDFLKLSTIYAAEGKLDGMTIPLKYILMSPYDMTSNNTTVFYEGMYEKILSPAELSRLKNPITEEDKEIYNGLPQKIKDDIKNKTWNVDGLHIKLNPLQLHTLFYKKQSYEAFAIPFGYPVLDDINAKLELKRMDQSITRTVENCVLLITMGAKPDEGGINQKNIQAMQQIFANGTTGRTIVSDWTTKGTFLIPDLNKVLGPAKYEILNQDIREGLQNVIVGEEKYGNTATKVQVFLDKLNEARNAFLENFLNPEIKRISKSLGFRSYPQAKFSSTDIKDNTEMMRVAVRMAELGLFTPTEVLNTIHRGVFPNTEDVKLSQEEYIKERKEGKWMPLSPVPIVTAAPAPIPPLDPNAQFKAASTSGPKPKPKVAGQGGRPQGSKASVSIESLKQTFDQVGSFELEVSELLLAKHNLTNLDGAQKKLARELTEKIVTSKEKDDWASTAKYCIENPNSIIHLNPLSKVEDLSLEAGLDDFAAALYVHSLEE